MGWALCAAALLLTLLEGANGVATDLAVTSPFSLVTFAPNVTIEDPGLTCWCPCKDDVTSVTLVDINLEAKVQEIVDNLTVKKSDTSADHRRKTSAPDYRPSAMGIGYVGTLVLVSVSLTILALDVTVLLKHAGLIRRNVRRLAGKSRQARSERARLCADDVGPAQVTTSSC